MARRRLRVRLKQLRKEAGLTQQAVSESLDWSLSKLIRIEAGVVGVSLTDVQALLQLYGVNDPAQMGEVVAEARAGRRPSWWSVYRNILSSEFVDFLDYESSATEIRVYQPFVVPGLLQTDDYARAVIQTSADPNNVDQLVEARMRRQDPLDREGAPNASFLVDEAALRRWVGAPGVMRAQLRRLQELNLRPNISIRAIPFRAGHYRGLGEPFVVLDLDDETVVYLESLRGDLLHRDDPQEISDYLNLYVALEKLTVGRDQFDELIDRAVLELNGAVERQSDTDKD